MLKSLQHPLRGLLALVFLLSAAPASRATYDAHLYDSLLKKIYKNADGGDGGDIHSIIKKALIANPNESQDLVDALIKKLRGSHGKLAENLSDGDLALVKKKLRKWLRTHRMPNSGGISNPESATTAP